MKINKNLKTLRMNVELTYDADMMHGDGQPEIDWFFNNVILGDNLSLFDKEESDFIGDIKVFVIENKEQQQ